MLASCLAILSYVPFEYVAKVTLVIVAFMFIVDPFPPLSRIIALLSLMVLSIVSRYHHIHQQYEESLEVKIQQQQTETSFDDDGDQEVEVHHDDDDDKKV